MHTDKASNVESLIEERLSFLLKPHSSILLAASKVAALAQDAPGGCRLLAHLRLSLTVHLLNVTLRQVRRVAISSSRSSSLAASLSFDGHFIGYR